MAVLNMAEYYDPGVITKEVGAPVKIFDLITTLAVARLITTGFEFCQMISDIPEGYPDRNKIPEIKNLTAKEINDLASR